MKFGQSIVYSKRKNHQKFFRNHAQDEAERLVLDLFLFFKKALKEVKASGLQLSFNIFQ